MTSPTIGILTPTTGSPELLDCLRSVQAQTLPVRHYLVIDGTQHFDAVARHLNQLDNTAHIRKIVLEENVGKGWYGHRVYASVPCLMNVDYVCYLDEDNWLLPHHVESLYRTLQESRAHWAYSLRKIYNKDRTYLLDDQCESLGHWPSFHNYQHIDTSCYFLSTAIARTVGPAWYGQARADRQFFAALRQYRPSYACSRQHTVCYRLAGNPGSVTGGFFAVGNRVMSERYPTGYPWAVSTHPRLQDFIPQ